MAIVMIDQDGVMLNERYQTNAQVHDLWQTMAQRGFRFVANSDTPSVRLQRNVEQLLKVHAQGLIAENGAHVTYLGHTRRAHLNAGYAIDWRSAVEKRLGTVADAVHIGDAPTWRRMNIMFEPRQRLILLDEQRRFSVSLYALVTDAAGRLQIDAVWANEVSSLVNAIDRPEELSAPVYNPAYGIMIAGAASCNKTTGYELLRSIAGDDQYYMIGDSTSDIIPGVTLCAVGNACNELKNTASFVATEPYTAGLRQCLEWIAQTS